MKRFALTLLIGGLTIAALAYTVTVFRDISQIGLQRQAPVDPPAPATVVRVLDVGQGDAIYVHNGTSRVFIDGGPDPARLGELLDSLGLRDTTIDAVILSHAHYDHYNGLLALFDSRRRLKIRYVFENKDVSTASSLERLRDSIIARIRRDSLIYRDTDDPCADGRPMCTITLRGGATLHVMQPMREPQSPNNRSAAIKLVGADSASFTMWLAGDAERGEIQYLLKRFGKSPGLRADILKADHHGSCNGVTARYLSAVQPTWTIASLAATNDYGHMHTQAKKAYRDAGVPWYRTDQNGTITITAPGTPGSSVTVIPSRGTANASGPSDRRSTQPGCRGM